MMFKTQHRMFIFACAYAAFMPKVTPRLFSTFKGAYPGLLQEIILKFRMQIVFQMHLLPPFFGVMYEKVHRKKCAKKCAKTLKNV